MNVLSFKYTIESKFKPYEDEKNSLTRELLEELDMEVQIKDYFATSNHSYESITIELIGL